MTPHKAERPKAADIGDERFLRTVLATFEDTNGWTCMWDLEERIPGFPSKVLRAKAGQLIKRKMLDGCTCGCRGDFELAGRGLDFLAERGVGVSRLTAYASGRAVKWEPTDPTDELSSGASGKPNSQVPKAEAP